MRFIPFDDVAAVPHVIVDGAPTQGTLLALSHWPRSGTPASIQADTSAEIVFNYLDSPSLHVSAEAVSNNHFDEDGLIGIHALLNPSAASRRRELLIDIAQAGDFGVYSRREAARAAIALAAYARAESSPLPGRIFEQAYPRMAAELYSNGLAFLAHLIDHLPEYAPMWEQEDRELTASEALLDAEVATIEEQPQLDLALVRIPEGATLHRLALHTRTRCTRLLVVHGPRVELRYRYESWVQLASRHPAPRVDLSPVVEALNAEETGRGRWMFDGVERITPSLRYEGPGASALTPDMVVARIEGHLRTAPSAWDPYG